MRFWLSPVGMLVAVVLASILAALPVSAAYTTYQIRGNAVAGANNISRIVAGVETQVFTNYPGGNAAMLAQCPNGLVYYAINGGAGASAVYSFNPQTPEVAPTQLTGNSGTGDAFRMMCSPAGVLYVMVDSGVVWTINTTTGAGTAGPTITGAGAGGDAAFDSSGQLWILNSSRQVFKASVAGGAATPWCTVTFAAGVTPATLGLSFPTASTTTAWTLVQQGGGLGASGVYEFTLPAAAAGGGAGACNAGATLVTNVAGSTATGDLAAIDVVVPNATVAKSDGVTTYVPGGTNTYTVIITNNSPYPVTYIITDNQPANVTFGAWTCTPAAAPAGSACGPTGTAAFAGPSTSGTGNTVTGTRVRLAASGGSATYSIPATYAAAATGAITNTASVAVAAWLPAPAGTPSASDTDVVRPAVAKTFGAASIADGGATTLVFTLTNSAGNPAQSAISLGDTLPTGLALNSATPAVTYSAGCSGPAAAVYTAGTRVLSGLTGIAMTAGTASCTVTVAGVTNQPGQVNASCAANPAAFTNVPASVTATNATNTSVNRCLVVSTTSPTLAKAFAPASVLAGVTSTLTITLSNPNSVAAALTAVLTDTLPSGLVVAATPNAATTCSGAGAVTAAAGGSNVSLPVTRSIPAGSSTTPGTCTVTVDVTSNLGAVYTNTIAAGALQTSNGNNAALATADLTVTAVPPTMVKLVTLISDPVNGATNPKAIPGAIVEYTLLITNPSVAMNNNSVVVTDPLSSNLALCVNATCGAGATPVSFTDGTPTSALTLPAANTTFSNTTTPASFTYTPVAGANGCDPNVSTIRVNPAGVFASGVGVGTDPNFTLKFRACIK